MIDVCLLGTGGMMPLPGRALTALYTRYDGRAILIDCGEGTQTAMREASLRFKCIDAIFITHFHADHMSGLPGLLLTLGNEGRAPDHGGQQEQKGCPEGAAHFFSSFSSSSFSP